MVGTNGNGAGPVPFPRGDGRDDMVKVIPQSYEMERSTLGAMMLDKDAIAKASEKLKAEDFYSEGHRVIFSVLCSLYERGTIPDLETVANELRRRGQLDMAGGAGYLMTMMEWTSAAANVEQYVAVVEGTSILRGLLAAAHGIQGWVYESADDVDVLLNRAESAIMEVGQRRVSSQGRWLQCALHDCFERLELQFKNRGRAAGLATGYDDLDRIIGGLNPSDLITIAARPRIGKTALLSNVAVHVAREKTPVLFSSIEMSESQVVNRLVSMEGRVDSRKFRSGFLDEDDWSKITGAVERLYHAPIFIDDSVTQTVEMIWKRARRIKAERGSIVVGIDYFQKIATTTRGNANRVEALTDVSLKLKAMARDLKCPVIVLAQLSRAAEGVEPELSHIRECGQLEAESDVVVGMWRDEEEWEDRNAATVETRPRKVYLKVMKNRHGPEGRCPLTFLSQHTRFENYAKEAETHDGSYARTEY